ncbi:MAG: NAD(P)/FAD-dependent oxidoreductase [Firmicutes bacterium]|nr:NAD(P)/FAD-dependent oxidoreductase [Bacillota bacterium]
MDYEIYDVMIIGSGPAGMSAAVNARVRNKSTVLISRRFASPSLAKAPSVHNYLGLEEMSGTELYSRFLEHARRAEARLIEADVTGVYDMGGHFSALTSAGDMSARAVIVATGAVQSASIPGESALLGAGVSYCATCDGPLYRGKRVVVLGYTAEAREEANFLAEICSEVTYVDLQRGKAEKGAPLAASIREVVGKVAGIRGESSVTHVELESEAIPADGVFVIRESIPVERLLDGLAVAEGAIVVDRDMATSVPGVFAAGDCTGRPWQVAKAVGEGLVAGLSAARYVDRAVAAARAEGR